MKSQIQLILYSKDVKLKRWHEGRNTSLRDISSALINPSGESEGNWTLPHAPQQNSRPNFKNIHRDLGVKGTDGKWPLALFLKSHSLPGSLTETIQAHICYQLLSTATYYQMLSTIPVEKWGKTESLVPMMRLQASPSISWHLHHPQLERDPPDFLTSSSV